ncbi:MAG TPA: hypothetical protein VGX68_10160 [Thermoanaerobaculia bacterium]|jgi:hypothetical protein|nr:hypothetical protein [Thermoanaerobaculia bacterium]
MDKSLSLADVLSRFEKQIALLRREAASHAERERFHRDRRAALEAELEKAVQRYEAFRSAAEGALPSPVEAGEPLDPEMERLLGLKRLRLAALVFELAKRRGPQERFGAHALTAELRQLLGDHPRLRGRLDERRVQVALRWLARSRKIFEVTKGRPHWESQYVRERPASP